MSKIDIRNSYLHETTRSIMEHTFPYCTARARDAEKPVINTDRSPSEFDAKIENYNSINFPCARIV